MSEIKTIDVRGLSHNEKEKILFPGIEELKDKEILRVILEFNPLPLVYVLKARGEFEISYEKEGPDEWILNVKRIALKEDRKEHFKELLKELKEGKISEGKKKDTKELFQAVDTKTLGLLEQELIQEGITRDEIRKSLCDIHLDVIKDALISKRIEAPTSHPIHTFMEEHKIILNSLNELNSLIERLKRKNNFESMRADLEKLREISHHLVEAESHHQREEETLFPKLEKHDIVEPPEVMKIDHVEFRKRKQELYKLAHNPSDHDFRKFAIKVIELGEYLTKELESHISKEDNILYQIALQTLSQEEWEQVKRGCDKVGYCCFTPEDQK